MELSDKAIGLLRALFEQIPPGERAIGATRYRADHAPELALLNDLEERQHLQRDHQKDTYRVPLAALGAIGGNEAQGLLKDIGHVYDVLRDSYRESPNQTVTLKALAKRAALPEKRVVVCVDYLSDAFIGGRSTDLKAKGATVTTSERLIEHPDFQAALAWWEGVVFQRPPRKAGEQKPASPAHGNVERFASAREQVLKAALALVVHYPEECRSKDGRISGAGIVRMIEQKSPLWWEDESDMLSHRKMTAIINDSLRVLDGTGGPEE